MYSTLNRKQVGKRVYYAKLGLKVCPVTWKVDTTYIIEEYSDVLTLSHTLLVTSDRDEAFKYFNALLKGHDHA